VWQIPVGLIIPNVIARVGVCGYFVFQWNVWHIVFDDGMPDFVLAFGMAKPTDGMCLVCV